MGVISLSLSRFSLSSKIAATRCNTLQRAATRCNALQRAATRCNALQQAATRCNTQQHAATYKSKWESSRRCSFILSLVRT